MARGGPISTSLSDTGSPKAALRVALRRRRIVLAAANADAGYLAALLLPIDRLPFFRVVAGYHPLGSELDPRPTLTRLAATGATIALPALADRLAPLVFRSAGLPDCFVPDVLGVPAPPASATALVPDLVLAPVLAFDRRGGRLGQGGGYFDRAIGALRAAGPVFVIGMAFAGQEVDSIPTESHDQALNAILTEIGYREV